VVQNNKISIQDGGRPPFWKIFAILAYNSLTNGPIWTKLENKGIHSLDLAVSNANNNNLFNAAKCQ